MKTITSPNNQILKTYLRLTQKKYRDRLGEFLVEGENLVREVLDTQNLNSILISHEAAGMYPDIEASDKSVFIKGNLFSKIARTKTTQGVIASVKSMLLEREEISKYLSNEPGNILVLDRLQDPGNIGTVIRTAEAMGYVAVIGIKGTGDFFSPKVVRAAAGSVIRMKLALVDAPDDIKDICQTSGRQLIGTEVQNAISLENISKITSSGDIALVIGNEGNGISREMSRLTDKNITIPMAGGTESLNAAVAAGIVMYETMKGRNGKNARQNS